jgi:hypothetical protein
MLKCKGPCGKVLPMDFYGDRCDACRQKKSRDKRQRLKRAYDMTFTIDGYSRMLSEGTISAKQARELVDIVWDRFYDFYKAVQAAEAKQNPVQVQEYDDYED